MVIILNQKQPDPPHTEENPKEKEWENPVDPENAEDQREREKIERQKEEAERRHDNLTDTEDN